MPDLIGNKETKGNLKGHSETGKKYPWETRFT